MEIRNKKAAFEMSMSTIIIIVLSVVFLILGLVLLRSIFGTATSSLQITDDKLKTQLATLFADENSPTFIKPEDGILKIRSGTANFVFVLGGRSKAGIDVKRGDLQYRLLIDKEAPGNCYKLLSNNEAKIKSWFPGSKIAANEEDQTMNPLTIYPGDLASEKIQISIPSGTPLCTQKVYYDIIDKTDPTLSQPIGGGSFMIEVLRKAII